MPADSFVSGFNHSSLTFVHADCILGFLVAFLVVDAVAVALLLS